MLRTFFEDLIAQLNFSSRLLSAAAERFARPQGTCCRVSQDRGSAAAPDFLPLYFFGGVDPLQISLPGRTHPAKTSSRPRSKGIIHGPLHSSSYGPKLKPFLCLNRINALFCHKLGKIQKIVSIETDFFFRSAAISTRKNVFVLQLDF